MAHYGWDSFDWDDHNKKSGNVQHLRTTILNRKKPRNAFSTITLLPAISSASTMFMFWMEELIGDEDYG